MRKTDLRRLEALEQEHRSCKREEIPVLAKAGFFIKVIVFAYYLGDLKLDVMPGRWEEQFPGRFKNAGGPYPGELDNAWDAFARALQYASCHELFEVGRRNDLSDFSKRNHDAYRRLFANVGLDFDKTAPNLLFEALVTMVDSLPDRWLNWLRCNLQEQCGDAEIAVGSNLPRQLSGDNFFFEE
jgi:hypothetical protein